MHSASKQAVSLAVFVLLTLVAPLFRAYDAGASQTGRAALPTVGILVHRQDDTFVSLVTESLKRAFKGRANVELFHAKSDQAIQHEQLDQLIAKKVDGIILNVVSSSATSRIVHAVEKANIPIVFFNREPVLDTLKRYSKARHVGTNIACAGTLQGDIIKSLWDEHPEYDRNKDGKFQYVMIQSSLDNPESLARTIHSIKQARENGVVMRQVGETLFCKWDEDTAYADMQLLYPQVADSVELIISNNDTMAIGAIRALNVFGYNKEGGDPAMFLPVIGVDAIGPAIAAIGRGVMSATVAQDDKAMGETAAAMLLNMLGGKDALEGIPYPWDKTGVAVRIPYSQYSGPSSSGQKPQ